MTEAAFPHIEAIDPQARKPNLLSLPSGLTATALRDGGLKAGSSAEGQSVGFQADMHCAAADYYCAEGFTNLKGQHDSHPDCPKHRTELLSPSLSQMVNPPTEGKTSSRRLTLCLT